MDKTNLSRFGLFAVAIFNNLSTFKMAAFINSEAVMSSNFLNPKPEEL